MGLLSNLKLIIAGVVIVAFACLYGAWKVQTYRLAQAQQEAAALEAAVAVQTATIEQGKKNKKAIKKASEGKQEDETQIAPIENAINQLEVRYFNEKESKVVIDLIYYWNCGGVQPIGSGCGKGDSYCPPPTKPVLSVSTQPLKQSQKPSDTATNLKEQ